MREIKFRVWDEQLEAFYYFGVNNNISELIDDGCFGEEYILRNTEQYTGLKDRHGKEIYEGDMVKIDDGYNSIESQVYFDHHGACIKDCNYLERLIVHIDNQISIEIIGNIHEKKGE